MAAARPLVSIRQADGAKAQTAMPHVFLAPIRPDIVQAVFVNMNKNKRQAYAVKDGAGMGHSAVCWGTGRAVARIPRVNGGGTSRAGQAAFGNMCRKGRMFAPTKTWRKWHRKINTNQKRYAVVSALAASALPALVMARGHKVENVDEVPLVVGNDVEGIKKTRDAVKLLKSVGAYDDVQKAADSYKLRRGTGKLRGRRHVHRRGPLVVYNNDAGVTKAFRNLPGVETCHVDRLNLLQLAPGGHVGRFIVWSKDAFERLDAVYGGVKALSQVKGGYTLPRNKIVNSDITSIINSDGVQSVLNAPKSPTPRAARKKNPLKNLGIKVRLNPYALSLRRSEILAQQRREQGKLNAVEKAREAARKIRDKKHEPQQRLNYKKIAENFIVGGHGEEEKKGPGLHLVATSSEAQYVLLLVGHCMKVGDEVGFDKGGKLTTRSYLQKVFTTDNPRLKSFFDIHEKVLSTIQRQPKITVADFVEHTLLTAYPINHEVLAEMKKLFEKMDTDSSGSVSKAELVDGINKKGLLGGEPVSAERIDHIYSRLDLDHKNELSWLEFLTWLMVNYMDQFLVVLHDLFQRCDTSGDGQIARNELRAALMTKNILNDRQQAMFRSYLRIEPETDVLAHFGAFFDNLNADGKDNISFDDMKSAFLRGTLHE